MAMMVPLQQTLKSLCSRTGWCYAVFWKLKRRSRMMLTWEDGYYDYPKSSADACFSHGTGRSETGGNPLDQGGSGDLEGQIGLAVARMSYYVYSMGEGIIGRVAFTGKHQWVFCDGDNHLQAASGGNLNNQSVSEKNPDGWQNQFAAGIKTIAVIAVPQGVVQLGSTKLMLEDFKWIDRIKSVFGALQTAPLVLRPDLLSEVQGSRIPYNSMPPFLSGSNMSTTARRLVTVQQGQPLLRTAEDSVPWQKFGVQASPVGISNMQGLQSIGGTVSVAGAIGQELQYQQAVKVLAEPLSTKYASTELGPPTSHVQASVPHFEVPANCNKKILPRKHYSLDDRKAEGLNDSTWMGLMTGNISHSLHSEIKRDIVVPTCVGGQIDEDLSSAQEDYSFKKRFVMCSMPDTKKEDDLSSVPSFGAGQQQQLDMQTVPSLKNTSSSSSAFECDLAHKCADLSSVTDKMVNQECFNDVHQAAVTVASHLPAKLLMPKLYTSEGFAAPSKDEACWNASGRDSLNKSESHCSQRELKFNNYGSQSDVNTLDELENFLTSFSKEESGNWDCSFAIGDELSQALGPAFWKGGMEELSTSGGGQKNVELGVNQVGKAFMKQGEVVTKLGSKLVYDNSYKKLLAVYPSESKAEPLLDAIVGNASNTHHSLSSNTDVSFSDKAPFSNLTGGMPVLSISQETDPACNSSLSGKLLQAASHHETLYRDISAGGYNNLQSHQDFCVSNDTHTNVTLQSWTDEGQSMKSDDTRHSQSKRSEDFSKSSKKRTRSGESTRPRPKDRQQIQDRVRELRDIVPNGSKCSIDALLEKTIKHMLFLHSVTLHADQLKNNGELKEDPDSGASWALDLGSQDKRYPILVKDLNQPRQMLVEMMCEESGLFLERADIIRSLGLTILRGVMESHKDKFWAKFFVEANRDVQRVDILVSLLQRLHLDNNSSSSSMTMASQSAPLGPQQVVDSSSAYTVGGNT